MPVVGTAVPITNFASTGMDIDSQSILGSLANIDKIPLIGTIYASAI